MLEEGSGVPKDIKEAAQWYEKAATQGQVDACFRLGQLYFNGANGFEKDYAKAAKWLDKPAAAGNVVAQHLLGTLYKNGWGVPNDPNRAFNLFQSAADMGYAPAQRDLGVFYCTGVGTKIDVVHGFKWLMLASDQGDFLATHFMSEFRGDIMAKEFHKAREMADDFKPKVAKSDPSQGK